MGGTAIQRESEIVGAFAGDAGFSLSVAGNRERDDDDWRRRQRNAGENLAANLTGHQIG